MPLALILIGAVLLLVAVRGTHAELGKLLVEDFTGSGGVGFFVWLAAIGAIGMLGWVPALKRPSRILLAIVIFGILASNLGVFQRLRDAIANPPSAEQPKPSAESKLPKAFPVELAGGGSKASGAAGTAKSALGSIPGIGSLFG